MSQITTHVLDTSIGKPAEGVSIVLEQFMNGKWEKMANGRTNTDGRISDLLPENKIVSPGIYQLVFDTYAYFNSQNIKSFYPKVTIAFEITDSKHYHVPLLLNPFGYSTYRGS